MKKNKQGESPGESDRELQAHVKAVRKIRSEVRSQMQAADIEDWRRWMEVEEEPGGQAVNIPTSYDSGQEEFDALRRLSEQGSWQGVIERLKDFVIDLGKTYGQGIRIGPARIMAEQPLFAMRGTQPPKGVSKVLEVAVRENTYSVEVKVNEDGSLSCDIVGISIPVKEALRVSVHSERGEELATAQSNESGNCRFTLPGASGIDDFLVLTFVLKETAESLLLRIPKTLHPR